MTRGGLRAWIVAALFVGTLAAAQAATPISPAASPVLAAIPFEMGGWRGVEAPPLDPEVARVLAADQYVHRYYAATAGAIEMDVAYYAQPRVGANMHSPLNCLPGTGWEVTEPRTISIDTPLGPKPLRELTVSRGSSRFAMLYWFQGRQRLLADELSARLHLLGDAVRRRPADAGLVRLIMRVQGDGRTEHAALTAFAATLIPEIHQRLQ